MPFNVPPDQQPEHNKKVKGSLELLNADVTDKLRQIELESADSLVEAYNQPVSEAELTQVPPSDMVTVDPQMARRMEIDSLRMPDGTIYRNANELFSQPLNADRAKAVGLVDTEGNATPRGELFFNLKESGVFNEDGTINEKGQAYLLPEQEIRKPENLPAFKVLFDDGLTRPDGTFDDALEGAKEFVGKVAVGAFDMYRMGQKLTSPTAWLDVVRDNVYGKQTVAEQATSSLATLEQSVKNVVTTAGYLDILQGLTGDLLYKGIDAANDIQLTKELSDAAEDNLYAARQRQYSAQQALQDVQVGEIAEAVFGIDNAAKAAQEFKQTLGSEKFNRTYSGSSAVTELFGNIENVIPASKAFTIAGSAPRASRAILKAQQTAGKMAQMDVALAKASETIEAGNSILRKEAIQVPLAQKLSSDIAARAVGNPELLARANQASEVSKRLTASADEVRSTMPTAMRELEELTAKRNSLATRIPEVYAQKVMQTAELGRRLRSAPARTMSSILERTGETLTKVDDAVTGYLKDRGLDQAYNAALGASGVVGLAGNPVVGAIGITGAALKTGKFLSEYGKILRYVGKEMENARGQIPFWKRVAAHTAPGSLGRGIAHTFNMFELGGATSDIIRRTGRGVAAAYPSDLFFEWLSDGGDMRPQTMTQAAAESLVIGGSFAAGGGAFMGTKKRMRELAVGDEINFRQGLTDTKQKALYEALPPGVRRSMATYSIANPTLNYNFIDSGTSGYDINTNTANININSNNPLKALVAHETLHHTLIKNNMEGGIAALFLGDTKTNAVGGLFRSKDGKLDPEFNQFKEGYYNRLRSAGMTDAEIGVEYPLDKIAVEYFIDQHADQYATMAETGELGALAARGEVRKKLGSVMETVLPKIPVLRDLHIKSGGMIDKDGAWVTGNGILGAEGIRQNPIANKMFREMSRRSSGMMPGQFEPLISDKEGSGAPLMFDPANAIDMELMHPFIQVDDNDKPILKDGRPVFIDKSVDIDRAMAGLTAVEAMRKRRESNYIPEKGEAYVDDDGELQPGWLSDAVLTEMFAKHKFNNEQKRMIRQTNRLIKQGDGQRMVMINFPATTRLKSGKVVYAPQKAAIRDAVPVAMTISKDGNILYGLMSVTKLQENIQKRAQSKRGKQLYSGNIDLILRDTQAMMDFHKKGEDSINYFNEKYGAVEGDKRKKFINTMFGLLNQKEQAVLNPMLLEDGIKSKDNVYRTYRADRVSKAVPMAPEEYAAMPFSYEAVSQVRMPEAQRAMPEGVSPEDLNPVANKQEAQGLWADGKRMFALNEMDEKLTPITSKAMLDSYSADAIGWIEPESQAGQMRFMPEADQNIQQTKQWNPNPIVATNKTARVKGIPERITDELFELIKNKPIVVGMADLLGAGGKIRGVDVSGGPGYPIQNFDPSNPDAITGVWASERGGINTILQNMVKTDSIWQDESGHNWALFAPHTMAQSAHKSNAQTPEIYISKVNDMAISGALKKATAIDLSDHIRANVPMAKDMPNIGTEKLTKFIHDAAFETRAAIMSELSNVRSRDLGAPSPETILTESRDPQYHGVEKNALTGLLLIDVDRLATKDENGNWKLRNDLSADDFNVPKHPSYGTVMPGKVLAHFDNPVPFRISTPEMINTMRTASPLSRIDYLLARMPKDKGIKFQPLTDQIKNTINEAQNISGNVPYIREAVKAVNGNWKKFTSGASLKGLAELIGAIHRSPARDSLTQYNLSELQKMIKEDKMEVHQLGDNDIWFGVKKSKDGNELVSVVNNTGIPGMLNLIMQRALEVGVNKLDAYAVPTSKTPNGLLPSLYKRYGWKEVERMPFDRQYLVERKKGEKKADHEEKIAQKEAALKMFWTEQGWDGQSNPDVVFMTYEKGRKTEITSGQSEGSLVKQRVAESGAASEAASGEVRGAGLAGGREQAPVGGPTQGDSGTGEGVLPRGFDSIVQGLRSASPIQIETIGITDAERKQFLKKLGIE